MNKKKIAVILSGCGNKDGSDVHESVLALYSIDKHGLSYQCYAPDAPQTEVIDFLANTKVTEKRDQLKEAARIARSNIRPLSTLDVSQYDALVIPGGGGAANKNLSDHAYNKTNPQVISNLARVIAGFHGAGKPIGAICAASILVGIVLKDKVEGITLATGTDYDYLPNFDRVVHKKIVSSTEIVVDSDNRVVSTPAYINDASITEVATGIDKLVNQIAKWVL